MYALYIDHGNGSCILIITFKVGGQEAHCGLKKSGNCPFKSGV